MSNRPVRTLRRALFPLALFTAVALFLLMPRAGGGFFFRNGDDPVVFFGDRVTAEGLYPLLIESYLLTRFPEWRLSFRNLGVSGDTAALDARGGLAASVSRDLRGLRPKAALLCYGQNDADGPAEERLPRYAAALDALLAALKSAGVRPAVLTPTPFEGTHADAPGGAEPNFTLNKFVLEAENAAARAGAPSADVFTPFLRAIETAQVAQPGLRLIPDGAVPGPEGQWLLAAVTLKKLGAPALVSHVSIDFAQRRVTAGEGCSAELDRSAPPDEIVFRRIDACLPWPVPEECHPALDLPGFDPLGDLSRFTLRVTGLPGGDYEVFIDGESAGVFHALELGEGRNFTLAPGPVRRRSEELLALLKKKNGLTLAWNTRVRLYRPPEWFLSPDPAARGGREQEAAALLEEKRAAEAARLEEEIRSIEARIEPLRRPAPRLWRVAPARDGA